MKEGIVSNGRIIVRAAFRSAAARAEQSRKVTLFGVRPDFLQKSHEEGPFRLVVSFRWPKGTEFGCFS
jgi:hypothetical protein